MQMGEGQAFVIIDKRLHSLLTAKPAGCAEAPCRVPVPAGISICEALQLLGVRLPNALTPVVNGITQDLSYILHSGDEVRLVVQISGG
ncbi:MAG: hypothetical protein NZ840_07920 [Anaerolineales bacterium]|nr:hypothetical protein [Anaerolineales bacterium]MDW8161966.1 hypothetical protein [Anaerolineales bacterium]